jgi:hypothetical protein
MRLACHAAILMLVLNLLHAPAAMPAGKSSDEASGDWKTLFDGKTLNGWKVIGCEAVVEDGAILVKSGNGLVQTEKQYGDFILEVDWKALKSEKYDSGIYLRYQKIAPPRPWPKQYQVNFRQTEEGSIPGIDGTKTTGLVKPGEWNHFKLTVKGTSAALEINGKPAWKADGLKDPVGYIGLQAEVPGGGQFLFRNIRIRELGPVHEK